MNLGEGDYGFCLIIQMIDGRNWFMKNRELTKENPEINDKSETDND